MASEILAFSLVRLVDSATITNTKLSTHLTMKAMEGSSLVVSDVVIEGSVPSNKESGAGD